MHTFWEVVDKYEKFLTYFKISSTLQLSEYSKKKW